MPSSPCTADFAVHERTKRVAYETHGLALVFLSFQALGIIYSDIGTSPLYVLNGIWPASGPVPSKEDVIGGISAIIWSLTLLPLVKYAFIALRFGTTGGEGGTFALYQGIYPREDPDIDSGRTLTGDSTHWKAATIHSDTLKRKLRWGILIWATPSVVLTCLLFRLTMADGTLTPAVSVTSAVGGIAVAKPSVSNDITPISIVILVVLFLVQRFGTSKLSFMFSPIALIWFLLLAGTGLYNITTYPGIFRAFDPSRAVMLFVRTRDYDLLAGILLCLTGCEAMFANLGHFNRAAIQLSFVGFVYPSLVLAYLGQGARLIVDGEAALSNIFYQTIPGKANGPLWWHVCLPLRQVVSLKLGFRIVFVFAILATIIASQALISATFSLFQQVINLKSFLPLKICHTSDNIEGQIYIPAVNWTLMIIIVILIACFSNSTNLTNAYGFAVATVMLSTTGLLTVHMLWVKHWPVIVAVGYFLIWGFFDGLFWGASVKKVPHGAWVPLMMGIILASAMLFWTWAKGLEDEFDGANRQNLKHFIYQQDSIASLGPDTIKLRGTLEAAVSEDETEERNDPEYYYLEEEKPSVDAPRVKRILTRIPTCAVFHKVTPARGIPHTFVGFIRQWPALPRVVVFLSVYILPIARVPPSERYIVDKTRAVEGFYSATYQVGFRDHFGFRLEEIVDRMCTILQQSDPTDCEKKIDEIRRVCCKATHIVPHYTVISKRKSSGRLAPVVNTIRAFFIESIYGRLAAMFPETKGWVLPPDE
ncbi:potassium transporter [Fistulina hepatica ATCC 64428]|uniref:Potassium transporter n=1 Tax=Fistulina hepatica ATCC 64428 TaxID=1128425 RepID=A0A0D7A538_9AGAR|nr:potassium transporter [Fistulina hepatica ATCC 64428]